MEASLEIEIAGFQYLVPKPERVIGEVKSQQPASISLPGVNSRTDCVIELGENPLGSSGPPESKPNLPFFLQLDQPGVEAQTMKKVVTGPQVDSYAQVRLGHSFLSVNASIS